MVETPQPEEVYNQPSINAETETYGFGSVSVDEVQLQTSRLPSSVLLVHVDLFLKHLFSIMPVFNPDATIMDCANPERLSNQRYAFLVALCAATHLQLNLDSATSNGSGDDGSPSGEQLITETLNTLRKIDPLENPTLDTLLTFFFLFAAYGNLNQPDRAWFYLSQSISFVFILNLDNTLGTLGLDHGEVEMRRRIFWLLFITERYVPT